MSPGLPRPSGRTATLFAVVIAAVAGFGALATPAMAAAPTGACKLLSAKLIKSSTGLTVANGKTAKVIDPDEETDACLWLPKGAATVTPGQIAGGKPGVYVALGERGSGQQPVQ